VPVLFLYCPLAYWLFMLQVDCKLTLTLTLTVKDALQHHSLLFVHTSDDAKPAPVGTTYVDPGATAKDNVDGDITSELTSYGIGAVKTTAPTSSSTPYYITYDVSDSSGNAATQGLREVVVACKSPKVKCTATSGTLFCSTSAGLCIESTTTTTTTTGTYPTIKLIGQAVLGVTLGTSYLACPIPQPTDVICDR